MFLALPKQAEFRKCLSPLLMPLQPRKTGGGFSGLCMYPVQLSSKIAYGL